MKKILLMVFLVCVALVAFASPALASDYGRDGPADFLQSIQADTTDSLVETSPAAAASGTFMISKYKAVVGFDTGDESLSLLVAQDYKNNDSIVTYRDGTGFTGHGASIYSMARHVITMIV